MDGAQNNQTDQEHQRARTDPGKGAAEHFLGGLGANEGDIAGDLRCGVDVGFVHAAVGEIAGDPRARTNNDVLACNIDTAEKGAAERNVGTGDSGVAADLGVDLNRAPRDHDPVADD